MTAQRLVVWRHGRTEWNASGRFQGHADVPLDAHGAEQAAAAAIVIAGYEPSVIVSSDLVRASATAQKLADLMGSELALDQRLREIHVGTWQGLTSQQIIETDPDLARRYLAGEDVRRSETGETVAEVAERVAAAMQGHADAAADGSTVVVVMHGLAARVGVCRLVGLPDEHWRRLGGLHNGGWVVVEWHRGGGYWRIREYNVLAPLPAATSIS
jgi:glucosyl-3-phosphoglycerate phosphatase